MLPIIGPAISMLTGLGSGLFSWLNKKADVDLGKATLDQREQDNRTQIALAYQNDLGNVLNRDLIMFSVSVHIAMVAYNTTFMHLIPNYTWTVEAFPGTLGYVPYAVIAWLFALTVKQLLTIR